MKTSVTVWKVNTSRVIPVNPLLFEYRTAECRLDWIDLLAFTAFHLSLDEDCNTAELL